MRPAISKQDPLSRAAPASRFTVLIERLRWAALLGALCFSHSAAFAQEPPKLAGDLMSGIAASTSTTSSSFSRADTSGTGSDGPSLAYGGPTVKAPVWTKTVNGVLYAKLVVVSNSTDPDLASLRSAVLSMGGSVYYRYLSVRALSVLLPASKISTLAARTDVTGVSPNRQTARTQSALELATGVAGVRSNSGSGSNTSYSGLDGSGVGIAVLDSGISWNHYNLRAADLKATRVKRAVDFLKVGDATASGAKDWTPGIDVSAALVPGSNSASGYENKVLASGAERNDTYGHGSHVAGVAAGRSAYQGVDSTGIAPNANLYDVRVLDGNGNGQLSDVLAGIDWVIYHAREYNIRIINLSLAADSTETYLTDPLCRAVRSAAAAGITVVVAAGNFGKNAAGAEVYGSISSPGNDPSVITVGSATAKPKARPRALMTA